MAIVLFQNSFELKIFGSLFFILFVLIQFSGSSLSYYAARILTTYPMIFFVTFLLPFTDPAQSGDIIVSFFRKKIYQSGLDSFIVINLKMLLIFAASLLVIKTSDTFRLLKSLERLKLPLWIISVLTYMHRLFYLLSAEQNRMQMAFTARYRYLPFLKRIKVLSGITIVYLTRIVERSDRTYLAMLSKGFNGKMPNGKNLSWKVSDSLFCIGFIIYFGLMLYAF
jgi:cobalt/nickel transport system permease protein